MGSQRQRDERCALAPVEGEPYVFLDRSRRRTARLPGRGIFTFRSPLSAANSAGRRAVERGRTPTVRTGLHFDPKVPPAIAGLECVRSIPAIVQRIAGQRNPRRSGGLSQGFPLGSPDGLARSRQASPAAQPERREALANSRPTRCATPRCPPTARRPGHTGNWIAGSSSRAAGADR